MCKFSVYILKHISFRHEFKGLDPIVFTKLVSIYLTSFYGSNLWDLYDKPSESLFKCWNIMVRMNWDIPRNTHKYLIEPISKNCHLKINLLKRFITFFKSLANCDKPHIKYLHNIQQNDFRSVFGRNCNNICAEAGVDSVFEASIFDISYAKVPQEEEYRIYLICELLEMRAGRLDEELTKDDISSMLNILCSD